MNYIILIGMWIASFIGYLIATWRDVNLYLNPKTRSKVVENFPRNMTVETLVRKFLIVNGRELVLFLGGSLVGFLLGAFY